MSDAGWLGALEGFYGEPYSDAVRLDLVRFLGTIGATDFGYAPKGDPFQRDRWREPYPEERLAHFRELLALGAEVGVRVGFVISPGLDWATQTTAEQDTASLIAKLQAFYDLGVRGLGIAFDDVPPGGADLGASHAAAVAAAVAALPADVIWSTCPVDYSASVATEYLTAFVAGLPEQVVFMWTGPGIVAPTIEDADVERLTSALGLAPERVVLADNFPVNDGPMAGVLHLGPYPARSANLPATTGGLLLNLMPGYPLASRIGLQAAVEWWRAPQRDRVEIWREVIATVPGIEPLARSCWSWLLDPGPDPTLQAMGLEELGAWLAKGCREGLAPEWVAELEPWLQAWEWEAFAMAFAGYAAMGAMADPGRRVEVAFGVGEAKRLLRAQTHQVFGIRYAVYPVTTIVEGQVVAHRSGIVEGKNLTDTICDQALVIAYGNAGETA